MRLNPEDSASLSVNASALGLSTTCSNTQKRERPSTARQGKSTLAEMRAVEGPFGVGTLSCARPGAVQQIQRCRSDSVFRSVGSGYEQAIDMLDYCFVPIFCFRAN